MTKKLIGINLAIILLASFILVSCAGIDYNDAVKYMKNGDYETALKFLSENPDYKDSQELIKECRYNIAESLIADGLYEQAIEQLTDINFENSEELIKESKFALAESALAADDLRTAITYLTGLDYNNSTDLLASTQRELGMRENADYDFLAAIEKSVRERLNAPDDTTWQKLVDGEKFYLDEFEDRDFYDENLYELADLYLEGLELQRQALKKHYTDLDIQWYEGMVKRFEALNGLYENYGLFEGDKDFILEYVQQLPLNKERLDQIKAIDKDLNSQFSGELNFDTDWFTLNVPITNNTPYTYDLVLYMEIYDKNDVNIDGGGYAENGIKPHETVQMGIYWPDNGDTFIIEGWEIYPYVES